MKRMNRLNETKLNRIIRESLRRILMEGRNGIYKGVDISDSSMSEEVLMSKIDALLEKGWSPRQIQDALDDYEYGLKKDSLYKW